MYVFILDWSLDILSFMCDIRVACYVGMLDWSLHIVQSLSFCIVGVTCPVCMLDWSLDMILSFSVWHCCGRLCRYVRLKLEYCPSPSFCIVVALLMWQAVYVGLRASGDSTLPSTKNMMASHHCRQGAILVVGVIFLIVSTFTDQIGKLHNSLQYAFTHWCECQVLSLS